MSAGHYSDELLIAFLDAELASEAARKVSAHLDRCWSCRARCQEIDQAITQVGRLFSETDAAVSDSVERIRGPLFAAMERDGADPFSGRVVMRCVRPVLLFAAALVAAAAVSRLAILRPRPASAVVAPAKVTATSAISTASIPERPKVAPHIVASVGPVLKLSVPAPATPIDLDEVELALRFRLHQTGADLRDGGIRIRQEAERVVVDGVVDNSRESSELEQIAAELDHPESVSVDVRLAGDIAAPATPYHPEAETPAGHREPSLLKALVPLVGSEAQLTERGNEAVATVEKMTDVAWALRHLSERFESGDRLSDSSRHLLGSIKNDYRARIRALSSDLRERLAFLPGFAGASGISCGASDPAAQVFNLRDIVDWLFAGRQLSESPRSLDDAAQTIAAQLACLETKTVVDF